MWDAIPLQVETLIEDITMLVKHIIKMINILYLFTSNVIKLFTNLYTLNSKICSTLNYIHDHPRKECYVQ